MGAPNETPATPAEELEAMADRMRGTETAANLRQAAANLRRINGDPR